MLRLPYHSSIFQGINALMCLYENMIKSNIVLLYDAFEADKQQK